MHCSLNKILVTNAEITHLDLQLAFVFYRMSGNIVYTIEPFILFECDVGLYRHH